MGSQRVGHVLVTNTLHDEPDILFGGLCHSFTPSFKETTQGVLQEQEEEKAEATTGLQIIFPRV